MLQLLYSVDQKRICWSFDNAGLSIPPDALYAQVASRALAAEESLRFSQTQLEIMKAEFAATCAQLAAVQTELAHQNAR